MKKYILFFLLIMPVLEGRSQDTVYVNVQNTEDSRLIALKKRALDQQEAADEQKARIEAAKLAYERQAIREKANKEAYEEWVNWAASVRQKTPQ